VKRLSDFAWWSVSLVGISGVHIAHLFGRKTVSSQLMVLTFHRVSGQEQRQFNSGLSLNIIFT